MSNLKIQGGLPPSVVHGCCHFLCYCVYSLLQEIDSDTFILVRVNDLLHDLLESHVTLQGMLQSRHLLEVRSDAEIWSDTLQQVRRELAVGTTSTKPRAP